MASSGGGDGRIDRVFTRRALLLGAGQLAGLGILAGRLYHLQVMEGRRYGPLADDNRISLQIVAPRRGRILDRHGLVLGTTDESFRAMLYPSEAGDVAPVLKLIAKVVPIAQADMERLLSRSRSRSRSNPLVVADGLTFEQVATLNLLAPQLPGVEIETAYRRKYVAGGEAMGHIVGYVGSVDRHAIDDDPVLRLPDIRVGKAGIERGMEASLRGAAGSRKFEVDARGRVVRTLEELQPKPGTDVTVTIDAALQSRVHARLMRERRASVVVMDIASGEVVALSSVPGYDPAVILDGVTEGRWKELSSGEDKPLLNRAVSGLYPPGSTFKMVTALAGLEAGALSLSEEIGCTGSYVLADQTYRCWKRGGHGRCNLHRALRESCDTYFYEIANRVGIQRIATMARRLGFGQSYECGLAPQRSGVVPEPDWKRERFAASWLGGETILTGIGQGYVLATPLQLAVMAARIASGLRVTPTLVRRPAGPPLRFEPLEVGQTGLDAVRKGLIAAVNESGATGANAILGAGLPLVAGKTGTSQVSRSSSDTGSEDLPWEQRDHALFVAYFPAEAPRYAISSVVEHAGGGGAAAAPLVRDVIGLILEKDPVGDARPMGRAAAAAVTAPADRA